MSYRLLALGCLQLSLAAGGCSRLGYQYEPLQARDLMDHGQDSACASEAPARDVVRGELPRFDTRPRDRAAAVDLPRDKPAPPPTSDLACAAAASQTGTAGGYLTVYSGHTLGQVFTLAATGVLQEVELNEQTLNGGGNIALWAGILAAPQGTPSGAPLAERAVAPLVPGWSKYRVDFSSAKLSLAAGTSYALRVRSVAAFANVPQHTLAFDAKGAGGTIGPLWLETQSGWTLAAPAMTISQSSAIYAQIFTCR